MRSYFVSSLAAVFVSLGASGVVTKLNAADGPSRGTGTSSPNSLVVHEWGTFTSFSGSDGRLVGFRPDNSNLPTFVYYQQDNSKVGRLARAGSISMETPVTYFYANEGVRVSVNVRFPKGWITEWFPFASKAPSVDEPGQSIRWNVKLLPGEQVRFHQEKRGNHYYHARETDSVPLQAEIEPNRELHDDPLHGGAIVQREKFLFYRGVGSFEPLVTIRSLGGGKIRVKNAVSQRVPALMLVSVQDGAVLKFKSLGGLDAGKEMDAMLPEKSNDAFAEAIVNELTAAGLYEKEAKAMVKTWSDSWFDEPGTRLLYVLPQSKTDELLPITIEPKPAEIVRVMVGRHDFMTVEQEAEAERQAKRARTARSELVGVDQEFAKLGRFAEQARQMAEKRIEAKPESR